MHLPISLSLLYLIGYVFCGDDRKLGATCKNSNGELIVNGDIYTPHENDPCYECTCVDGIHDSCKSKLCSPISKCEHPKQTLTKQTFDKCCEFVCVELPGNNGTITINKGGGQLNTTNLGLRLVASTVTSFLILALLLFMIHRLRQRRLLLMIRRLNNERLHNANNNSSQRYSVDGDIGVGYYVGRDQVDFYGYGDPPPPYTLWKPPDVYIPPGEPPPPYEASLATSIPSYNSLPHNNVPSDGPFQVELPQYSLSLIQSARQAQFQPNVIRTDRTLARVRSLSSVTTHENSADVLRSDVQYGIHPNLNNEQCSSNLQSDRDRGENKSLESQPFDNFAKNLNQNAIPKNRKHLSIQLTNSESMNWETVASDSSSSSPSPTCERTISPTSSDSSSILDFVLSDHARHSASSVRNGPTKLNTLPKYLHHPRKPSQSSGVSNSLDKTFDHVRRFSFLKRKQNAEVANSAAQPGEFSLTTSEMTESQCSTMSNPETSNWTPRNYVNLPSEESNTCENIYRSNERSKSLNLSSDDADVRCKGGQLEGNYINVAEKTSTEPEELETTRPKLQNCVTTSTDGSSRSGSICSETGERKYRRSVINFPYYFPNGGYDKPSAATANDTSVKVKICNSSPQGGQCEFKTNEVSSSELDNSSKKADAGKQYSDSRYLKSKSSHGASRRRKSLNDSNGNINSVARQINDRCRRERSTNPDQFPSQRKSHDSHKKSVWVPISHQNDMNARAQANRSNVPLQSLNDSKESKM